MELSQGELDVLNELVTESPSLMNAFDRFLEEQGIRDVVYDPTRFVD